VTITLEEREDGGMRIYSDDIPGLILSGPDPSKLVADLPIALEVLKVVRPLAALQPPPQEIEGLIAEATRWLNNYLLPYELRDRDTLHMKHRELVRKMAIALRALLDSKHREKTE
jgi:hypothetical protein